MKKITIKVNLNHNSYPIIISKNLLNNAGLEIKKVIPKAAKFLLITDKNIPKSYIRLILSSLKSKKKYLFTLNAGEKSKNMNFTKLDKAKKSIVLPLFCPCCANLMKNRHDKLFYIQYNRCFNCQIDFETDIRKSGLWEEYEKNIINSDIDYTIKNYTEWIDEIINNDTNNSFTTEVGDIENWVGSSKKKLLENKEETIKYLQTLKKTSNLT